jgi:succinoglycan biosynthesis protein ExoL
MSTIAFFGHNANEPAIRRRVRAFQSAGHDVVGFMPHRGPKQATDWPVIDLGETRDNAYGQRIMSIFRGADIAARERDILANCDAIYARNLDMLAVAVRARRKLGLETPLIYECLDVHHRLTGPSPVARLLRRVERRLLAHCALVVISSPRFETEHFAVHYPGAYRAFLLENLMIEGDDFPARPDSEPVEAASGGPLRIGCFGNLRCRRSLDLLLGLARRFPDDVTITLRGYPAPGVFDNFEAEIAPYENVSFGGRYSAPGDLAAMYGAVDLVWAGDWYEAGANSLWLLPNRIYEGGYFATPSLAPDGTETARWLREHGSGILLAPPVERALEAEIIRLLKDRTPLQQLRRQLLSLPRSVFVENAETTTKLLQAAQVRLD